jgi:hypothetical protein
MLVEIEQHPMQDEARRAMLVVGYDLAATEILGHKLMRREVVLEIDDHRKRSPSQTFTIGWRAHRASSARAQIL